jgi:predicted HTH transcriptional regulator
VSATIEDNEKFDALHGEILEYLDEGRCTPSYLAKLTGESRQQVSDKLHDLWMAGQVIKIHRGLYEISEPEEETDS